MKRDIFENQYRGSNLLKVFFADVVCFLVVAIFSVGFCYSYFSDKVGAEGDATMASISIKYCTTSNIASATNQVKATLNGGSEIDLTNTTAISPGDSIVIKGYAINNSGIDAYALARLEIATAVDTEVVWYNIDNNKPLYAERGLFQVGASVLQNDVPKPLSIPYTFEGDRYTNEHTITGITLTLHAHQKDFLNIADDYNNYSAVNGYAKDSIYAAHHITGRERDVWTSEDANVMDLSLADLTTDNTGAYLINTCKDWMIFSTHATGENTNGMTFKLNAYLDFNNNNVNKNIGTFYGTFDGQGYTLSNLNLVANSARYALFRDTANANIINLGLDGAKLSCSLATVEPLTLAMLVASANKTTIDNCFVIGAKTYDNSVSNDINITTQVSGSSKIGGIVAELKGDTNDSATAILRNSYAKLNIYTLSGESVGGLVGGYYTKTALIEKSYFVGSIHADTNTVNTGLIVGNRLGNGNVNSCFAIALNFVYTTSNQIIVGDSTENSYSNLAYINNTGVSSTNENYNKIIQVGENLTDKKLTINTFYSVGKLRDAFDWNTSIWASNIYSTNSQLPVLRVFYNF